MSVLLGDCECVQLLYPPRGLLGIRPQTGKEGEGINLKASLSLIDPTKLSQETEIMKILKAVPVSEYGK